MGAVQQMALVIYTNSTPTQTSWLPYNQQQQRAKSEERPQDPCALVLPTTAIPFHDVDFSLMSTVVPTGGTPPVDRCIR